MRKTIGITAVAAALLAVIAIPVYAHCGKCLDSAKEYLKAMKDGNQTLVSAIQAAQATGKGDAICAKPTKMSDGTVHIHVYLVQGDKMWMAMVDAKSGTVTKTEEAKDMEMHEGGEKHEEHKKPAEHGEKPH